MAFEIRSSLLAVCLAGGAIFSALTFSTPAIAETSTSADPADIQRAAIEDPMVCKRMTPTGSRIVRRYCRKQSEWDAMREGGQRAARDAAIERSQYGYREIGPGGTQPY